MNGTTNKQQDARAGFALSARVYRTGTCIGMVRYHAGLSSAKLRGYRDAARYGAVRVNGGVVIDAQYR